jgi:hypothetical protein
MLLMVLPAHGQVSATNTIAPELMRYLQLSGAQAATINQLAGEWKTTLQNNTTAADQIWSQIRTETEKDQPDASTLGRYYLQLASMCHDVTTARADFIRRASNSLTADQLTRLQTLADALQIMPRVIEAQRAGILPDSIDTAPVGLPAGQITVSLTFLASSPQPLPGCLSPTQVQPGTVPVLRRPGD